MLNFFYNFLYFCISANILILVHEFGHFLTAKQFNVAIKKFSIGLGRPIFTWHDRNLTKYQVSIFPFGGYVEIFEEKNKESHNNQKIIIDCKKFFWKRIIIIFSGSIFNIFFSILIFWAIFFIKPCYKPIVKKVIPHSIAEQIGILPGMEIQLANQKSVLDWDIFQMYILKNIRKEKIFINLIFFNNGQKECKTVVLSLKDLKGKEKKDLVYEIGIIPLTPKKELIISKINQYPLNASSQLKVGDKIIKFNGKNLYEWKHILKEMNKFPNRSYTMEISRNDKIHKINLCLENSFLTKERKKKNHLTFQVKEIFSSENKYLIQNLSFLDSLIYSLKRSWYLICIVKNVLLNSPNQIISNIRGPMFIGKNARESINCGMISYLTFLSTLSINIGIFNLFPLPILDGGNLLFCFVQRIINKLNLRKISNVYNYISLISLLFLLSVAFFNDIIHMEYIV